MTSFSRRPSPLPVVPSVVPSPSIRATLAALYTDYAAVAREINQHALADRCELRASALMFGGDGPDWSVD
jgi:hypothetical protein